MCFSFKMFEIPSGKKKKKKKKEQSKAKETKKWTSFLKRFCVGKSFFGFALIYFLYSTMVNSNASQILRKDRELFLRKKIHWYLKCRKAIEKFQWKLKMKNKSFIAFLFFLVWGLFLNYIHKGENKPVKKKRKENRRVSVYPQHTT